MLVKYIDSDYIINTLQKTSWADVEEPDFYITMASNRVKALIFPSEQGDPDNIASYTQEQQDAIKLATAIYTLWYFDTNYDFSNGSVSVNFGGVSMSESKTYNGEMVLPNVFDILKQTNLIPTTETFIFNGNENLYGDVAINPEAFKNLQQEVERQANVNVAQDAKIVDIYDKLANIPNDTDFKNVKEQIENINQDQLRQNELININSQNIALKQDKLIAGDNIDINKNVISANIKNVDLSNYYTKQEIDTSQQTQDINITTNTNNIVKVDDKLNRVIDELNKATLVNYKGEWVAGTTAKLGEVWSFNNQMWLCKVETSTNEPTNTNDWDLLSAPAIDLNDYYNKTQVDQKLTNYVSVDTTQDIAGKKTFEAETTFIRGIISNSISSSLPNVNTLSIINGTWKGKTLSYFEDYSNQMNNDNDIPSLKKVKELINETTPDVDLSNYYTKAEIDTQQQGQNNRIDANYNILMDQGSEIGMIEYKLNNLYQELILNINNDFGWSASGGVYYLDIEASRGITQDKIVSMTIFVKGGTSTIAKSDRPLTYLNISDRNTLEIWVNFNSARATYPSNWNVRLLLKK